MNKKPTNPPVCGIYESNNPKYAGFIIAEEDEAFCYLGGFGDWIVFATPFDEYGEPFYIDAKPQRFVMGRDLGEIADAEIEVCDELYYAVMNGRY
jgi:hypothetical protein